MNSDSFVEWLGHLLHERTELRIKLRQLRVLKRTARVAEAQQTEDEIYDLILAPISDKLTPYTKPSRYLLVEAAHDLLWNVFTRPESIEKASQVWDYGVAHSNVGGWSQDLKDRLLDVCGPLDFVLAQKLATVAA